MAVVLPIISAVSAISAAGGVGAALTAGFASFAAVAGGFMAGAGLISGNKKLQQFGGLLSLAGGLSTLAGKAIESASTVAGAGAEAGGVAEGAKAIAENSANSASAATSAWDAAGATAAESANAGLSMSLPGDAIGGSVAQTLPELGINGLNNANGFTVPDMLDSGGNLMDAARQAGYAAESATPSLLNSASVNDGLISTASKAIIDGSSQIKSGEHLQALLDKVNGLGKWVKQNKELVAIGGTALQSAFDPRYEALDYEKSLRSQRLKNLNSPIAMQFNNPIVAARGNGG